jgi:hypothetical protein
LKEIFIEEDATSQYLVYLFDFGDGIIQQEFPLYEVASKLKYYFIHYGRGYCISSFIDFDGSWFANISGPIHKKSIIGESEPEVIFKAAEWIVNHENIS